MNQCQLKRQFRKKFLQLQAEQHRQSLVRELGNMVCFGQVSSSLATNVADSTWLERIQPVLSMVLPDRWFKYLAYALAFKKLVQIFAGQQK